MPHPSRFRRLVKAVVTYGAIAGITLALLDVILIVFNILPPRETYGDPDVGWIPAAPTGRMVTDRCVEYSTGEASEFLRNDRGVRTELSSAQLLADSSDYLIAVTGDSQTELCAPNADTHFGVLETRLRQLGVSAVTLGYGAGRYSPLQSYLAFKKELRRYHPQAFVLNVYTGNDLYDLLRVDDRPFLVPEGAGYRIHPPEWLVYDNPKVRHRSRVMAVARGLLKRTGLAAWYTRLRFLSGLANQQHAGLGTAIAYMNDLRRSLEPSVGYPAAFSAQILNQQLFFHYFPASRTEALGMMRAVMQLARQENPGMVLVLSPLPSYQLTTAPAAADSALRATLERLPVSYEQGVQMECELYEALRKLAQETGWLFVDVRPGLRAYEGRQRLYNDFDYHFTITASSIIGRIQAEAIARNLRSPNERQ